MEGSYQIEALEGRETEMALLSERARMRLEGFEDLLERHGFPSVGAALEVGCGQGIRTRRMAERFPHVSVTGIDRSPELLTSARSATTTPNVSFADANLYELPFADGSFDFVYARLVFMHLAQPREALQELRRVLKPGGRILIEDADRDAMFFEPAPASFPWFWQAVQEGQRRLGGDPNVGRKLGSYFKELGFGDVRPEVQPILGDGADIAFLVRTLMPSLNIYLDPKDRPQGQAAIDDLAALARDPRAAFYHFWYAVSARP